MGKLVDKPNDPRIPTLAAVLDESELSKELKRALPNCELDVSRQVRLKVLKWHKASRCTFEIMLPTASGWREVIGKVYAEDRADVYRAMEEIRRAGFSGDAEFSVARPLAYVPSLHLLVYDKVDGKRARSVIVDPNASDRIAAVQQCARWLVRFQVLGPRSGPQFCVQDHFTAWEAWLRDSAIDLPFTGKARELLAQLQSAALEHNGIDLCPAHGMYTCGQLFLLDGQAVTIDWDTLKLANPSHDVARFLVDLKRMAMKYFGSMDALDWAAEVFLKAYTPTASSSFMTSLSFQRAAIYLERAKSDVDKQRPGWSERAERMLDEGLRTLTRTDSCIGEAACMG